MELQGRVTDDTYSSANSYASRWFFSRPPVPGMVGMPRLYAMRRAATLSPMVLMTSVDGPTTRRLVSQAFQGIGIGPSYM